MGIEAGNKYQKKKIHSKKYGGIWSVSAFMCLQNRKKKIERCVEEPTQSLLNKKDVYTSTIYSKEIRVRSCSSSSQHRAASKVNQHFIHPYFKHFRQYWVFSSGEDYSTTTISDNESQFSFCSGTVIVAAYFTSQEAPKAIYISFSCDFNAVLTSTSSFRSCCIKL